MIACRVYFYRTVLGLPFSAPKGSVDIRSARDESRAVEAAKLRFARRHGVSDWTVRADAFDTSCGGS